MVSTNTPTPDAARDASSCDVIVIGGGPAGATAATLLARRGRRVVLIEKSRHPRFHIGESLLPANLPLLRDLGVAERVAAIGIEKWGVEFNSPDDDRRRSYIEFGDAWDKSMPKAWQVRRDAFDEILFRRAAEMGAEAIEGCKATRVEIDRDGATVDAVLDDGAPRRWRARFLIDATGRDTLLASQFGWKVRNERHNSAALYGHFTGAKRLEGRLEGNISIFWFRYGWFWFIPLADGSTSVGAVCWPHYLKTRDKPLPEFFADTVAMAPALAERLRSARLIDDRVFATGNYSYGATQTGGERFLLLGDAYAFIDPVFSSGVYLAMASAYASQDCIDAVLDGRARDAQAARKRFDAQMRKGPREFSWFIHRMTNPAIRDLFMQPANPLRMQEAVISLLAGDIFGKTPIRASLTLFKLVYYFASLAQLPRSWRAWRMRQRNIRDVGTIPGENVIAPAP